MSRRTYRLDDQDVDELFVPDPALGDNNPPDDLRDGFDSLESKVGWTTLSRVIPWSGEIPKT